MIDILPGCTEASALVISLVLFKVRSFHHCVMITSVKTVRVQPIFGVIDEWKKAVAFCLKCVLTVGCSCL